MKPYRNLRETCRGVTLIKYNKRKIKQAEELYKNQEGAHLCMFQE